MSADREQSEDSESSAEVRWAPHLEVSLEESRNISYVDLLEAHYSSKDLEFPSETSSDSAEHHYPLLLQSINERLEKYGHLAIVKDVAMRSKAPDRKLPVQVPEDPNNPKKRKKTLYMEADENFYDLSDKFIDDKELHDDKFSEKEFNDALDEGFYVLSASDLKKKRKKGKSKVKKEVCEVFPAPISRALRKLAKLYVNKTNSTMNYFPKGAQLILKSLRTLIDKDQVRTMQRANPASVLSRVASITGRSEDDILKFTDNKLAQEASRRKLAEMKKDFESLKKTIHRASMPEKPEIARQVKEYLIRLRAYTDRLQESSKKRSRVKNFRAELEAITEEVKDLNPSVCHAADIEAFSFEDDVRKLLWPNGFEPILSNEYDTVE